nr:glycosyl hydrolase 53 family protein [Labilibaculum sp.]
MNIVKSVAIASSLFLFFACSKSEDKNTNVCGSDDLLEQIDTRDFKMGFTSWNYAPDISAINDTYQFITENADIYSEQFDYKIPWKAWINKSELPEEFTNIIQHKLSKKIANHDFLLAVSLLNNNRNDLLEDFDGTIPNYNSLDNQHIEDAYFDHLEYLIGKFNPDYLVMVIEANELLLHSTEKWEQYKLLMSKIRPRIKAAYPNLRTSESITLHNWYKAELNTNIQEISDYAKHMDFVAISFYPYFKDLHNATDFQKAFDFLHAQTDKPIAFVETAHLAENLEVAGYDIFIASDECQQKEYLETLAWNAYIENYEFIIWWAHRDYDELWDTFPEDVKDLGKLWKDTGLLDENGKERPAFETWKSIFNK